MPRTAAVGDTPRQDGRLSLRQAAACRWYGRDAHSIESLNDAYSPENEVEWGRALADFAAHQARWDAADDEIGYSRTDELIRQSETAESALLDDLPETAATSIEGILAKLKVILRDGEHWEHPDDFPWPHIRSVLGDLSRHHKYRSGDAMTAAS
ncbi:MULTISPECIES: hypothetical protein [unclassified Mesorhizobium]|uniref:hypothetical protein n=1 Tax=unclassified Mesorhizobium TaxID=325217 RepID=UPI000FE8ABF7|nr:MULTISPECIES: hypothetical protein [unclassified Mesorhizobium]RWB38271.1 MAG: hypothetical protein EOQ46_30135 [Mesorhizobium sp.]RWB62611.1 MAG: hypothetical protein EOQ48_10750 [Mesorhizobium sp.]RWB86733.1 MAG: hypothetical protein EOQ51_12080 [Mesorhizobium sp.]RWC85135.1 MAG: hypothetical protein EOS31_04775 [Mesorhizobium sp.]TIW55526.1 MAG: hypothetical protein E5V54_16665 [Mesorhizobium sp.]